MPRPSLLPLLPLFVSWVLTVVACGDGAFESMEKATGAAGEKSPGTPTTEPGEPAGPEASGCVDAIPAEVLAEQDAYSRAAYAERQRLYAAAVAAAGVIPATFSARFARDESSGPYPAAVPLLLGTGTAPAAVTYEVFHGFGAKATVYETSPGSHQYFFLDYLGRDGTGYEQPTMMLDQIDPTKSLHAWHVTADNRLLRIKQVPTVEVVKTMRVCGCAPDYIEIDDDGDGDGDGMIAPPLEGIFLLPGTARPTLLQTKELRYTAKAIEFESQPATGKRCAKVQPSVAC